MLAAVLLRLASSETAQMMPAERNIFAKWSDMVEAGGGWGRVRRFQFRGLVLVRGGFDFGCMAS